MASGPFRLWQGHLYTVIFEANRGRIDNPHLIYPASFPASQIGSRVG